MILEGRPRLVFVGGKGGVGKTTTASALALRMAEEGRSCLLVSTDPAHSLGDLFDRRIGSRPTPIGPGLHGLELDPDEQVDRYLDQVRENLREFVRPDRYHEIERQLELTRQSPGAVEAATMDRMAELMMEPGDEHEVVVFDTAPTGHTLRLLSLPEIMAAWTDGLLRSRDRSESLGRALERLKGGRVGGKATGAEPGPAGDEGPGPEGEGRGAGDELSYIDQVPEGRGEDARSQRIRQVLLERRRKFHRARRLLLDPEVTAVLWVLVPEKLPILETDKAVEVLRRFEVPLAGMVVNRVLPEGDLGAFLESRRRQEAEYLRRIDELFGDVRRVRVPLLARDVEGVDALREVGGHLMGRSGD